MGRPFKPQSREEYWGNDKEMIRRTAVYEEHILRLVKDGMVRDILRHPWQENSTPQHHVPRVSVHIFSDSEKSCNSTDTSDIIKETHHRPDLRAQGMSNKPFRRLILMEGLDPRFAERLGVELDIPPEFWLAHCDQTCRFAVVDGAYQRGGRSKYWRVTVPQIRQPHRDQKIPWEGDLLTEAGAFSRLTTFENYLRSDKTLAQRIDFDAVISFWGRNHQNNADWTAIILVDPHRVRLSPAPGRFDTQPQPDRSILLYDFKFNRTNAFKESHSDWRPPWTTQPHRRVPDDMPPHRRVLYDTLDEVYRVQQCLVSKCKDPFDATSILRNLTYSIWDAHSQFFAWRLADELVKDQLHHLDHDVDAAIRLAKKHSSFRGYQHTLEYWHSILDYREDIETLRHSFTADNMGENDAGWDDETANGHETNSARSPVAFEDKRWTGLDKRWEVLQHTVETFLETYATRADMLHTVTSDRESRSASQLAKLAAVAVPFTVVSAIFSMGGDYAAGEKSFGVYWAISVPLTAVLFLLILCSERISRSLDDWKFKDQHEIKTEARSIHRKLMPRREKPAAPHVV